MPDIWHWMKFTFIDCDNAESDAGQCTRRQSENVAYATVKARRRGDDIIGLNEWRLMLNMFTVIIRH